MSPFNKLLVPTDFSPCSERAFDYAMQIAENGSDVVLFHVFAFPYDWYYWDAPGIESLRTSVEEYARERLTSLVNSRKKVGVNVSHRLLVNSHVGKSLMAAIKEEQPDIVVMGTKGWTDKPPPMGSVAEQIARRTETPVMMVPGTASGLADSPRILVPLYASEASALALHVGEAIAESLEGHLDILHVRPDEPFASAYLGNEPIEAGDLLESEYRLKRLHRFTANHIGHPAKCRVHMEEGNFIESVAGFVEDEDIGLVVVARSDVSDRPHKAELIAHEVKCPVLVVPVPTSLDAATQGKRRAPESGPILQLS